jgi:hypothetical protein
MKRPIVLGAASGRVADDDVAGGVGDAGGKVLDVEVWLPATG